MDGTQAYLTAGNLGVGTSTTEAKVDITQSSGGYSIIAGANAYADARTDDTRKFLRIGMPHYDTDEEPLIILTGDSDGSNNYVNIGGGTSLGNAATAIKFFTGSSTTTTLGAVRATIDSNGNVGIGTTSPSTELTVYGTKGIQWSDDYVTWRLGRHYSDSAHTGYAYLTTGSGGEPQNLALGILYSYNHVSAEYFYSYSDESLKQNIQTIPSALDKISQLKGVNFEWKDNGEKSVGLIAQDVEKVFPELVKTMDIDAKASKAVAYGNLVAPLIEAVKELKAENDSLVEMISALEDEKDSEVDMLIELIEQLKNRIEELEKKRG